MSITIKTTTENVDWVKVKELLGHLSQGDAETQRKLFENSGVVTFMYDDDKLIGCARALTDGIAQAAVYNIALDADYRGRGLGRQLMEALFDQLKGCTIILYTHPHNVGLYEKFKFRRQKTAYMRLPEEAEEKLESMGFFFPKDYRNENEGADWKPSAV